MTTIRFGGTATVALFIGPSKTAFHVHEDLLCEQSAFFKAAFRSEWRESTERTIELPDDSPDLFELFIKWLYLQPYPCINDMDFFLRNLSNTSDFMLISCQLYVLAEKYDVKTLRNSTISLMYRERKDRSQHWTCTLTPSRAILEYVYANTPQTSCLRRLRSTGMLGM